MINAFFRETKIVLKGENAAQLTELAKQAEAKGLPNYLVQDAGRTQVGQITMPNFVLSFNIKVYNFSVTWLSWYL